VARPVLIELLRFIAANEELPRTLARYPGHDRDTLGKLLAAAADRLEEAEGGREPTPAGGKGVKVRKASEAERAAQRTAAELEDSMQVSRAEQERRKRERAAEGEREREAARAVAAARPPRTRLFTDGAARGNPGPAGAGAVIVSPEGHIVAKIGKFLGDATNNVAEYTGLILGLRRARAMGIKSLEVLSDSELMVRQLAGDYAVKAEHLRPLFEEAKALLAGFADVEVRHIPREENAQADLMSNRAIDERL
jgi:ribonuclease HI